MFPVRLDDNELIITVNQNKGMFEDNLGAPENKIK